MPDNKDVVKNGVTDCVKSGHESGHEFRFDCPDKPKSNGKNGQSGQNKVGDSDGVRYNANDCNEINHDKGHFIGHVR